MWGRRVLPRLTDNFLIQSIPVGNDSLNRAWWFIMGVITQSFSPKSTTWLPTQHTETHRTDTERQRENERDREILSHRGQCTPEMVTNEQAQHTRRQSDNAKSGDTHTGTHKQTVTLPHKRAKKKKTTVDTRRNRGSDWGMRHTSLMPGNSRNNFLVLIRKGDGEMRSWLWVDFHKDWEWN